MEQIISVKGHDGRPLTLADLPPPNTVRWVIRRKAEIVAAVNGGLLSLGEACDRYGLNVEEFKAWEFCYKQYGLAGLKVSRLQLYCANPDGEKRTTCCPPDHQLLSHAQPIESQPVKVGLRWSTASRKAIRQRLKPWIQRCLKGTSSVNSDSQHRRHEA
jgi:Protein of unknown function (DUF1153)